jgi:transcriptional regulator with PAS, ATPase and Fis domain
VLQEHEFRSIGSAKVQQTDFRLICATNRSVEKALLEGRLREDLYYRINTFQIEVPPLRDRGEDIPALVSHFIQRFGGRGANRVSGIDQDAMETLCQHLWPGNVRELQNAIEHAAVIASGRITQSDLPLGIRQAVQLRRSSGDETKGMLLFRAESMALQAALERSGGNKSTAAKLLGISRATIYAKMRQSGLDVAGKRGRPKKIS